MGELCTAAVAQNGLALQFVPKEMKGDRELCMAAVAQNPVSFAYLPTALKHDETVVLAYLRDILKHAPHLRGGEMEKVKPPCWLWIPEQMRRNERIRKAAGLHSYRSG